MTPLERFGCTSNHAAPARDPPRAEGNCVARVHAGADGRFSIRLRAGDYLLVPRNGKPFPRAKSQSVSVRRHRFTTVTIRFDSGIRGGRR
jgi:hypothetical protein